MSSPLIEKREQIATKQKLLATIFEQAGEDYDFTKVKALDGTTEEKVEKVRALNRELEELTAACKRLELDEIGRAITRAGDDLKRPVPAADLRHPDAPAGAKSIGQAFVESKGYQSWKASGGKAGNRRAVGMQAMLEIELKTLFQTSAGWAPESTRIARVIDAVTRPIQILDLLPMGVTGQAAIVYMQETTRTHAAAETAEGNAYAESTFALTEQTSTVRKITDSIPVTDEQLDDEDAVRSYLDQRLRFGLRQRLDGQVLNGDGNAPNLRGILQTIGIQTQAKAADPTFDAIHKAITKVRLTGRANPNAIVLHDNDWQDIRLTRTADGIYILGNPAQAGPMTLFGLPVTLSDAIAENTGLVGDFANFCQLFDRKGIEVQVGYSGSQFVEGKQTLRADMRVAFVVYRPAAFCTVTGI